MRKLSLVFVFLVSIVVGNTQPYPLLGSPNGNTIVAVNALKAFQLPRGADTTLNGRNDSVGMLFYKTDKSVWLRVPSGGTANRWTRFGGSLDSLYATQAWALSTFPQLSLQYNNPSWVATLLDSKLRSFSATNGQFLRYNGTTYVPTTLGSGAYTDSLRYLTGTGVSGRVPFYTGTNTLSSDTGFAFNSSLQRLGVNIQNPQNNLDVNGTTFFRDAIYNTSSVYGKRLGFHLSGAKSNVFGGHYVGNLTNVGDALGEGRNTVWGTIVMPLITTANRNIGVGFSVMQNLRVGQKNVIISNAGLDNADSVNNNTGVGEHVLRTNARGNNNTVMGFHSAELAQGSNNVFYGGNVAANQVNGDGNHIFAYNGTVFDPNGSNQMNFANIIYGTNITGGVNARVGVGTNNPQVFFSLSNNGSPDIGLFKTNGVTNSRNWAFRINGVEEGDFLIYQSAANGTTPLSTARFQISRLGNVNIGTTTTIDNALLNVSSTTRGTMPFPRMTNAQRTALTVDSTRVGMHVYQTDGTEGVYVYKSTGWAFAY
jgi:hypothetical protein